MVIVFSFNENFVQHFLVCLYSILEKNRNSEITVYVLNKDLTEKSIKLLHKNTEDYNVSLNFIQVGMDVFKGLKISDRITIETYFRLSIPDLLPAGIDRVIYMDCDIVVIGSLEPLWLTDLENKAFGAVPEYSNIRNKEMGLGDTPTFNAGVMLVNVAKWRSDNISAKVFAYMAEFPEKIKFHDQDALNGALIGDILQLPLKWNLTTPFVRIKKEKGRVQVSEDLPVIIHFNEECKPWHYPLRHPYKSVYNHYLLKTPFLAYVPDDRNTLNIILHYLAVILISLGLKKD